MNRESRRTTGSLGKKGKTRMHETLYLPVKGSASKDYPDAVPGSSDGRRHEYGSLCVQRWVVQAKDGVLRGFRGRKDAMARRKAGSDLPRLVTIRNNDFGKGLL